MGGGHIADGATSGEINRGKGMDFVVDLVNVDHSQFGLRIGMAGEIEIIDSTCKGTKTAGSSATCGDSYFTDNPYGGTAYTTLKLGPLSLGVQGTFKDPMHPTIAGIANKRAVVAGAARTFGREIFVEPGIFRFGKKHRIFFAIYFLKTISDFAKLKFLIYKRSM